MQNDTEQNRRVRRRGPPPASPATLAVFRVCQEVRKLHPSCPATLSAKYKANGNLRLLKYVLGDGSGSLEFTSYTEWENSIEVTVTPITLFQDRVLTGDAYTTALDETKGFLDPPTNSIPFSDCMLIDWTENRQAVNLWLNGLEDVDAGVRFLLNRVVFTNY